HRRRAPPHLRSPSRARNRSLLRASASGLPALPRKPSVESGRGGRSLPAKTGEVRAFALPELRPRLSESASVPRGALVLLPRLLRRSRRGADADGVFQRDDGIP